MVEGVKKPLVILAGPTAVGKTRLSLMLAEKIGAEIISADSMQVYRGMDIGTAKIMPGEMQGIRHHLIDIIEPDEAFSVSVFKDLAVQKIDEITGRGRIPLIVGGTGFYIQAVLYDVDFTEHETDLEYRRELTELYKKEGPDALYGLLLEKDPDAAEAIHKN
ncbi:MAG: tRNA (adenosine(37)-N6)-dimethylallyltransferase MiaA, partial [Lachnospiraceae bacterium]|nr:tRNA (adenosine(37)-N6)-dimethylallyltransferase MiaA [Lachnospiraceae bacterium]